MPAHMTDAELDLMEKKLKKGAAVDEIMKMMQRKRREKGLLGPSRATVYRFKKGDTYERDAEENRGRTATLPSQVLKVADGERKRVKRVPHLPPFNGEGGRSGWGRGRGA